MTVSVTALSALFVVFATLYPEALGNLSAANAGLILTYAIQVKFLV